ncbi:MAG: hypothetical protein ACRCUY_07765, partial [Thermoguttaceae bacterium]
VTCLVLPLLVICTIIPFYRIYTLPVVDLGYRLADPSLLDQPPRFSDKGYDDWVLEIARRTDAILKQQEPRFENAEINRLAVQQDVSREMAQELQKQALLNESRYYAHLGTVRRQSITQLLPRIEKPNDTRDEWEKRNDPIDLEKVDLQFLKDGIRFFESQKIILDDQQRAIESTYQFDRQIAKSGLPKDAPKWAHEEYDLMLAIFRWLPWERTRVLRHLDNWFQFNSHRAEQTEKLLHDKKGNWKEVKDAVNQIYKQLLPGQRGMNMHFALTSQLGNSSAFLDVMSVQELERRGAIIELALMLYKKEHGQLPKQLDELVTAEILQEVPLIPILDIPFYYVPFLDGTEKIPRWRPSDQRAPYLACYFDPIKGIPEWYAWLTF